MGDFSRDGTSGTLMRGPIDLNGLPEADKAKAGLEMMQRRAQREDPEAALQLLNHVVADGPLDA